MKWFKHVSTAGESRSVDLLVQEFGIQGYAWWFLLLELCAEKYEGGDPKFVFTQRIVRQKLRTTWTRVQLFLDKSQTLGQLSVNYSQSIVELQIPKLAELKDEYTRKSGHAPDTVAQEKEEEKEKEEEQEKRKNVRKTKQAAPEVPTPVTEIRDAFLESYRNEFGREYPGWGAVENSKVTAWLKSVSLENAKRLCGLYPKWNDPWVTKVGHPLGVLITQYVQLDAWARGSKQLIAKIASGKAAERVDLNRAVEAEEMKRGLSERIRAQNANDLEHSQSRQGKLSLVTPAKVSRIPGDPFGQGVFDPGSEIDHG